MEDGFTIVVNLCSLQNILFLGCLVFIALKVRQKLRR